MIRQVVIRLQLSVQVCCLFLLLLLLLLQWLQWLRLLALLLLALLRIPVSAANHAGPPAEPHARAAAR